MKFVQIGNTAIAVDHITNVYFIHDLRIATIFLTDHSEGREVEFRLNEYELFFKWWSNRTDVEVLT